MGKYIRKAKTTGEVAVMDVSQSFFGVRTRAKTLALQRLKKSSTSTATSASGLASETADGSYLQLRSRRLEKPPVVVHHHDSKRQKQHQGIKKESSRENPNPNSNSGLRIGNELGLVVGKKKEVEVITEEMEQEINENDNFINYSNNNNNNINESKDFCGVEASFGENVLDIEARERGTRESTPCNLITDPENVRTPSSTTRPTGAAEANQRVHNSRRRDIPTAHEMDEFFLIVEAEQQRQFIEKYNFDPVNDKPLLGHYEWEKLHP